jgi:hypothetical protein
MVGPNLRFVRPLRIRHREQALIPPYRMDTFPMYAMASTDLPLDVQVG